MRRRFVAFSFVPGLVAALFGIGPGVSSADTTLFGPVIYRQHGGAPTPGPTQRFNAPAAGTYTMRVTTGGQASATVSVNGAAVIVPADFLPAAPPTILRQVVLQAGGNALRVDLGGAYRTSVTVSIFQDTTPPTISATATPAANVNGWNRGNVTVAYVCSDGGSGMQACPAPVVVSTQGSGQVVTRAATDRAGNTASASVTLSIDKVNPTVASAVAPAPNASGWNRQPVTVTFSASDAMSGILAGSLTAPRTLSGDGDGQSAAGQARDRAGRTGTHTRTGIRIDQAQPVLTISSPASGATVSTASLTISGTFTDALSGVAGLTVGATPVTVQPGGAFSTAALPLAEGPNSFTLTGTDVAGNTRVATVSVTRVCENHVADPGFESGLSGFEAQDATGSVTRSDVAPLAGTHSLRIASNGYGNNFWWQLPFSGGTASRFRVSGHLRSDVQSTSELLFCAMVYFADDTTDLSCTPLSGAIGDKGIVSAQLDLDPARPLESVRIRLTQEGSAALQFTLDSATACLDVVTEPTGGGGGGPPGGGGCPPPSPPPSVYPGYTYSLPTVRPFIALTDYTSVDQSSTPYVRFKNAADAALGGSPPYAYSATHSVLMYAITGQTAYIDDAISRVEQHVQAAETAIGLGQAPAIAGDSYLEVGFDLEQLALTYDYGYARLSPAQRTRWAAYAEQALFNVWNPEDASWGGTSHPWSGWSIDDPGNNYHFSFLRATKLWALATQDTDWLTFLQSEKFGPLSGYYALLPGGGSREGTGYGTAQKNLFENYLWWRASTGEDLASLSTHARDTIDYWVHATVPTRDRFAPIGDQSRSSVPELYDFHENLVHTAVVLAAGTPQAARGTWWLQNNSVDGVAHTFNLMGELLPYPSAPVAPTQLDYHAEATGHFFSRSSWATDATWLSFVAGRYDQSHAHHDQGSFTLFKGDWLAVTSNIASHSGLQNLVESHNVIRFEQAGVPLEQNESTCLQSTMTAARNGGVVTVQADLRNAYSAHPDAILGWTRDLELSGDTLRVQDSCTVAAGVQATFQLHVPVQPVVQGDGSIQAGALRVVLMQPGTVDIVTLTGTDVTTTTWRIDITSAGGCSFDVLLDAN